MNSHHKRLACLAAGAVLLGWIFGSGATVQADEIPEKYRMTVNRSLEYLARMQAKDGHWGAKDDAYPVAVTSLVGIALLMEGSTVQEGKYAGNIRKAADWLMEHNQRVVQRDGLILSRHPAEAQRYMIGHGFAMLFLSCVYGDQEDQIRRDKLKDVLMRAVKFAANAQCNTGGFSYTSSAEGDDNDESSVTITLLQGLRACRNAGIAVPKELIKKSRKYLENATSMDGGVVYSLPRRAGLRLEVGGRPALTAGALACTFNAGDYQNKHVQEWFKFCKRSHLDKGPYAGLRHGDDEYIHYYFAQALYNLGDDGWDKMFPGSAPADRMTWIRYRDEFFPYLVKTQKEDGSFPIFGGDGIGAVNTTALFATIMQLDRGVVPFYQRAIGKLE